MLPREDRDSHRIKSSAVVFRGKAQMGRTLLAIVGLLSFLSGARGALAFTTYPVDPVITFDRQADPDQLSDKMSNGQSGERTFGLPGGLPGRFKLQFSGPSSSSTPNSPFVGPRNGPAYVALCNTR
jgi:hypothetical protein